MSTAHKRRNTSEVSEDELDKVFKQLDDDGNGYITPREAKKAYKILCEKFNLKRVRGCVHITFAQIGVGGGFLTDLLHLIKEQGGGGKKLPRSRLLRTHLTYEYRE